MKKYFSMILIILFMFVFISACSKGSVKSESDNEEISSGKKVLGIENIITKEKLSGKYKTILIKDFSFEGTNIQEVDETKHPDFKDVVSKLGKDVPDTIKTHLQSWGTFGKIVRGDSLSEIEGVVVLEAKFTKITTGNRALRFFVGFGAGTSTVGIEGRLIDKKTGEVLATFENNQHSPVNLGTYNAILPADGAHNAKKIATFIKKLY
jgi:hypothetical protein